MKIIGTRCNGKNFAEIQKLKKQILFKRHGLKYIFASKKIKNKLENELEEEIQQRIIDFKKIKR